jgi:hypothetical protein
MGSKLKGKSKGNASCSGIAKIGMNSFIIDPDHVASQDEERKKEIFRAFSPYCLTHDHLTWDGLIIEKKEYIDEKDGIIGTKRRWLCKKCYHSSEDGHDDIEIMAAIFIKKELPAPVIGKEGKTTGS